MKESRKPWSEDATKRALYLYFQLTFGQIHSGNPEIIALASRLGRTASSVAMKLANFASLDPKILETGRKGLQGASALDRRIWEQFHADWTSIVLEMGDQDDAEPAPTNDSVRETSLPYAFQPPDGATTTRAEVEQRIGQAFFRRAVLANFDSSCCVTGIAAPQLLRASHISPWKTDALNRHNPRNGLCLSATFDCAFDRHLMTVTQDLEVHFSSQLRDRDNDTRAFFAPYEGQKLRRPTHLSLDPSLLAAHNDRFIP